MRAPLPLRPAAVLALGALLALGGLGGCGDEGPTAGGTGAAVTPRGGHGGGTDTVPDSDMRPPVSAWNPHPQMGAPVMRLRNANARAGITTVNHSGAAGEKEFLIEAVGVGAAWFDFDKDGLLDVYVPDGDEFENYDLVSELDPETKKLRPLLRRKEVCERVFRDQLWRNNGDGSFTDVAEKAGVADERWSFGATAADFDADGWTDLYVSNFGSNRLWHNNGNGTFTDVAPDLGATVGERVWSTCSGVADIDGDERLDLYVAAYADPAAEVEKRRLEHRLPVGTPVQAISGRSCRWKQVRAYCGPIGLAGQHDTFLRQTPDGSFEDRTVAAGLRPPTARYGFQVLTWDFNEDGRMDVYVANDSVESFLWQSEATKDGSLRFRELADVLGVKFGAHMQAQAGMGAWVADVNEDGLFDIFKTNFALDYSNIYLGQRTRPEGGSLYFKDKGLEHLGQPLYYDLKWGCGWIDFDNDADLDLYVANGHVYQEADLHEATGSTYKQFNALIETVDARTLDYREIGRKAVERLGAAGQRLGVGDGMDIEKCSRGASFVDVNNDGRVDIFVTNMNDAPDLILNTTPFSPERAWAYVTLEQPGANREALGASLEIRAAGRTWRQPVIRSASFLGSNDPRIHLGLGQATSFDIIVTWPGLAREKTTYTGLGAGKHWQLARTGAQAAEQPLRTFEVALDPEPAAR